MNDETYDEMMEEINSVTDLVHKNMLLQKYGLIPPKLTVQEQADIHLESAGISYAYAWVRSEE